MWQLWTRVSEELGSDEVTVGFKELRSLFQPQWFCVSVILHGKPYLNSIVSQSLIALLSSCWTKIPTHFYWCNLMSSITCGTDTYSKLTRTLESSAFLSTKSTRKSVLTSEKQLRDIWSRGCFWGSKQQSPKTYREIIGKMLPGSSQQGLVRQWGT